jgi:hypothetical protein
MIKVTCDIYKYGRNNTFFTTEILQKEKKAIEEKSDSTKFSGFFLLFLSDNFMHIIPS